MNTLNLDNLLARNILPDPLIRLGIRQRLASSLDRFNALDCERKQALLTRHVEELRRSPVAVCTDDANRQHYELPTRFFQLVLGKHLKYSCGYWDSGVKDIDTSEARMLALTCERAELRDGQRILELGCGWGSLTLWMAEHYPQAQITAVSNSATQRAHIEGEAARRGLRNVTVRTVNMVNYEGEGPAIFDRVVSVEMFEHMKNYALLMERIAAWLKPGGKLFVHIFTHRLQASNYDLGASDDFISQYFFTGGQMPSHDLLLHFQDHLRLEERWAVSGAHYQKTSEAWLERMDANREEILPLIRDVYGAENTTRWWVYWRVFFLACAEMWGYARGQEWIVSHYRFSKP